MKNEIKLFWKWAEEESDGSFEPTVPAITDKDRRSNKDSGEILLDDSNFVDDESDPDE